MKKEPQNDFLDKIQEADFIEILRLKDRNCITAVVGSELQLHHKLATKIAELASLQDAQTILLLDALHGEGDVEFMEDKPNNLDVIECGYDDFNGFISAMSRIATADKDMIIISETTPPFRSEDMYNPIKSFGQCCSRLREEANRLEKNIKLLLIGYGNSNELSSYDAVWFDNILDIYGTKYPEFYLIKDRKSNHYPLRDKIIGFSLENDRDCIHFFSKRSKSESK